MQLFLIISGQSEGRRIQLRYHLICEQVRSVQMPAEKYVAISARFIRH